MVAAKIFVFVFSFREIFNFVFCKSFLQFRETQNQNLCKIFAKFEGNVTKHEIIKNSFYNVYL